MNDEMTDLDDVEKYTSTFDSIRDGYALFEVVRDREGRPEDFRFIKANETLATIARMNLEELIGKTIKHIVPQEAGVTIDRMFLVLESGEPQRFDEYLTWLDKHVEGVVFHPQPEHVAIVVSDATTRKGRETQVRLAAKMEAIGTLAGGLAHEINNPINVIMNYAELMPRFAGDTARLEEFSAEILSECQKIADIVRNLVTFARRDAVEQLPTNLSEVIESATGLMTKVLSKDHIELTVQVPDGLSDVICQPQQVQQVLVNLLDNSRIALNRKFEGHHTEKTAKITARAVEYGDRKWIRVTVRDNGIGIPKENLERVFDPYFSTCDDSSGTGLGLTVSRAIIEEQRGLLKLESEYGHWTLVHIDLRVNDEPGPT